MTESLWLDSSDPAAMVECLRTDHGWGGPLGTPTARKVRLWACAWWRSILPHESYQEAYAQRVEDGKTDYKEMLSGCRRSLDPAHFQRGASLLREIVGNPFCPLPTLHHWLTPTVLAIANVIYDERTFDHLPILADALEDAGCDNEEILQHCRGWESHCLVNGEPTCLNVSCDGWQPLPGPHVRGCHVLDLILGKE